MSDAALAPELVLHLGKPHCVMHHDPVQEVDDESSGLFLI